MKPKILFTLLFSVTTLFASAQVLFDPATYPQDSLPAGMTIDSVDGKACLRVILDEWNSYIKINPGVAISKNATHFRTEAKLGTGISGFGLSQIKTFLKLTDSAYNELASEANTSSDKLVRYQVKLDKKGKVGYIQVAGQETTNYAAVTGDTLWLGKVMAVEVDTLAIFDPADYDPANLPNGMSIVEVDSVKYCRIILNGENSNLDLFPYTIGSDVTHIRTKTKYRTGSSGYALPDIGIGIYIYDAASVALANPGLNVPPTSETSVYKAPVSAGVAVRMRVGAVGKPEFEPIVGDTIWVGKVRTNIYEAGVIFDPAQYDPDELPAGMEIVRIEGMPYLKAPLKGWDNFIAVEPINASAAYTHFSTNAKYKVGTSGYALDKINTFLKLVSNSTELGASGSASSADFTKYSVRLTANGPVTNFQFAGQETTGYTPVTGDTLWIGKTYFEDKAAPSVPGSLVATVDTNTVTLTWVKSTDNQVVSGYFVSQDDVVLDTVTAKTFVITNLEPGTYTFKVVAFDNSGNPSGAASVEAIILLTGIRTHQAEKLTVYPNPVSSTLQVNQVQGVLEMKITSLTGSVVKTVHNTNTVDVSGLKAGLYLIQVKTRSGIYSSTFIKE